MKISVDVIKKDKELDSEYNQILDDFKLKKITEFEYIKKLKESTYSPFGS